MPVTLTITIENIGEDTFRSAWEVIVRQMKTVSNLDVTPSKDIVIDFRDSSTVVKSNAQQIIASAVTAYVNGEFHKAQDAATAKRTSLQPGN